MHAVAEVVESNLARPRKGLSYRERKMLETARQILISELVLVKGVSEEEVVQLITDSIEGNNKKESV